MVPPTAEGRVMDGPAVAAHYYDASPTLWGLATGRLFRPLDVRISLRRNENSAENSIKISKLIQSTQSLPHLHGSRDQRIRSINSLADANPFGDLCQCCPLAAGSLKVNKVDENAPSGQRGRSPSDT